MFVSDSASDIGKCFVCRQLPAALDRYLTAFPAMSLAPVAPFLSAQPCWCGLHKAHAERLAARYRRWVNFDFNGAITQLARERARLRISR